MGEEEVGAAVPKEQRQGWGQFLKSIATFSGDLSSLTAPSFILSPVSLIEFPAYWGEHPDEFANISKGKDEIERMNLVLKWFIGTLKGQFTARNISSGSEKKPLNPILGELFFGNWPNKNGRGETLLTAEQVSHHPPVTAYHIENKQAGITLEGHCAQKTSFSGRTIQVKQVGHAVLRVKLPSSDKEELYLITLPNLLIEGLWYGSPYVELTGNSYIQSTTGILTTLSYTGKGYFSGKAHSFKATIGAGGNALYTIEGEWAGVSKYKGKSVSGGSNEVFWDASTEREEVSVEALEKQGEMESRKVWKTVANGIRTGDYETASKDKARIENAQRQKRKDEAAAATPHQLEHFVHVDDDQEYSQLAAMFKGQPATEDSYRKKPRVN
ncbi:Protein KES1 [Melanopsichium pennsylvanicum]|uniref:Protein KES1 n=2 Tax=Melanopsichium pennsylvanicum TaxID=63383 RepID=A0AAJ5C6Y1_9BASI|nr:related to KES1-Member of an oxysterol-binding protein family [Melanopsichium pennsylvanicum 4]SNX85978.1 Protein KES1 [Melanopsichium pennsylvanicum]